MASSLEDLGAPRTMVPLSVEPIILELEGKMYMRPLLQTTLVELINRRHGNCGGSGGGSSGNVSGGGGGIRGGCSGDSGVNGGRGRGRGLGGAGIRTGGSGGGVRVWVRYEVHLPALSLQEREKSRTILSGTVLLMVQGKVLWKNSHLCGL